MVGLGLAVLSLVIGGQEAPDITVGIRPSAIRVGDHAVVSVRVRSSTGLPEFIEWLPPMGIVIDEIRDRESAGLGTGGAQGFTFEREYILRGDDPGTYQLPPVGVMVGGEVFQADGPELSVHGVPLRWPGTARERPRANRRDDPRDGNPVLPGNTPPLTGEMTEAYGQNPSAYGQWWGYPPYASTYPWGLWPGSPYWGYGGLSGMQPGWTPSLYGPSLYGPGGTVPDPTGPNGGWPLAPPGSSPGVTPQGGMYWPWYGVPGNPWYPGGMPFPNAPGAQGQTWQGNLGVPGSLDPSNPGSGTPLQGHTLPPLPGGQWPEGMGGGWAETATGDPWWPEIVPEVFEFSTWVEAMNGDVSLGAAMTPIRAYEGQQVTYVATASMVPGAFLGLPADPEYLPPEPSGFWSVDLPDPIVATPSAAGGSVAQSYTFRRALFPLAAGDYMVPPGQLLLPREPSQSPALVAWDTLGVDPLALTVVPIPPAGDLPGYAGAVGRYRLEAGLTPERIAVGETALLVVRVLGVGNVSTLPPPEVPPIYGAEMAPGVDFSAQEVRDGVVGGGRTFTWLIVPREPGPVRIGPILFSYFDPYVGDFGQAMVDELTLEVTEFPGGSR